MLVTCKTVKFMVIAIRPLIAKRRDSWLLTWLLTEKFFLLSLKVSYNQTANQISIYPLTVTKKSRTHSKLIRKY